MDRRHFDAMTKTLSRDAPRRVVMKAVGAAALGGMLNVLRQRDVVGAGCNPGQQRCSGKNGYACLDPNVYVCCKCKGQMGFTSVAVGCANFNQQWGCA